MTPTKKSKSDTTASAKKEAKPTKQVKTETATAALAASEREGEAGRKKNIAGKARSVPKDAQGSAAVMSKPEQRKKSIQAPVTPSDARGAAAVVSDAGASAGDTMSLAEQPGKHGRDGVEPEIRYQMIAEAAYYRAQARGFAGGEEMHTQDWLEATAEIDRMLGPRSKG